MTTKRPFSPPQQQQQEELPPVKKHKKNVSFKDVTVYYFSRAQGFICVPSQGGSSLGMDNQHCEIESFSVQEHLEEKRKGHIEVLKNRKKLAAATSHSSTNCSETEESEELSDISESEMEAALNSDDCIFLQPLPIHQRRALLRRSGVRKIDSFEKEECRSIRVSRENCGCECKVFCDPDTCSCSREGIKCQVDRMAFPCGCTNEGCGNLSGRIEFNPFRVRSHFIHTLMRIKLEKEQDSSMSSTSTEDMAPSTSNSQNGSSDYDFSSFLVDQSDQPVPPKSSLSLMDKKLPTIIYGSPFSPDESSYSESSDSDELYPAAAHHKQPPPELKGMDEVAQILTELIAKSAEGSLAS